MIWTENMSINSHGFQFYAVGDLHENQNPFYENFN